MNSDFDSKRKKVAALHNNLTEAHASIATLRERASLASHQASELNTKLEQERMHHEQQITALEAQLKAVRSDAARKQIQLSDRLHGAESEKFGLQNQLGDALKKHAETQKKLAEVESSMAMRLPELESRLNEAAAEIDFLKTQAFERNTELVTAKREAETFKSELEEVHEELNCVKIRKDEEACHFRKALHEKDVEIRELQDGLQHFEEEQRKLQESLSNAQKSLEDTILIHTQAMTNSRSAHRAHVTQLKEKNAKQEEHLKSQEEEIKDLKKTVEDLQKKWSDQRSHLLQDIERLKSSAEKTKNSLEKKLREKENLLKDCEVARAKSTQEHSSTSGKLEQLRRQLEESEKSRSKLEEKLSIALERRDSVLKELENIKKELERNVKELKRERDYSFSLKIALRDARAETRMALDTVSDTEKVMLSVYADAIEKKDSLDCSYKSVVDMNEAFKSALNRANEDIGKWKKLYDKLRVRFVIYIKCRDDDLKAAGDSARQNKAESERYLNELTHSKTELEIFTEKCQILEGDLLAAHKKIKLLAASETALLDQDDQNKRLLADAEAEVESLKSNLERHQSNVSELKCILAEKESELDVISADLLRERSDSARQIAECEKVFSLIESRSKESNDERLCPDETNTLSVKVDMLLQNISDMESELQQTNLRLLQSTEENAELKNTLSLQTANLAEVNDQHRELIEDVRKKEDLIKQLELTLKNWCDKLSVQGRRIASLENDLGHFQDQAESAVKLRETLHQQMEEERMLLTSENSRLERLTNQMDQEKSVVDELKKDLQHSVELKNAYALQLDEKTVGIQDLSQSLIKLNFRERLPEDERKMSLESEICARDKEVARLLSLLERAHQECKCKHDSARGDGNKEVVDDEDTLTDLKTTLAERDADVSKLRSVIADLQSQLSFIKSSADNEVASYRLEVQELMKEVEEIKHQVEDEEVDICEEANFGLRLTTEQTKLAEESDSPGLALKRHSKASVKRTVSEGTSGSERERATTDLQTISDENPEVTANLQLAQNFS